MDDYETLNIDSVYIREEPYWFSRSSVKFQGHSGQKSAVSTPISAFWVRFRTITQVLVHGWLWNIRYRLKVYKRGTLLIFKVIRKISRSQRPKSAISTPISVFWVRFRTITQVLVHGWLWNIRYRLKVYNRGALLFFKVIRKNSWSQRPKKVPFRLRFLRFEFVSGW